MALSLILKLNRGNPQLTRVIIRRFDEYQIAKARIFLAYGC